MRRATYFRTKSRRYAAILAPTHVTMAQTEHGYLAFPTWSSFFRWLLTGRV